MSLLSKYDILDNLNKGIVIHPFNEKQLVDEDGRPDDPQQKTTSYDVRIGKYFYRRQPDSVVGDSYFNPYSPKDVKRRLGACEVAQPAQVIPAYANNPDRWENIGPDDLMIMLRPGEIILGHTLEFIGGTLYLPPGVTDWHDGTAYVVEMKARSSIGRVGIEVCRCAGWGDIGYINRWTMEVCNTTDQTIPLIVGTRVAQFKFYRVSPVKPKDLYGADPNRDHYQGAPDLDSLVKAWKPEMLLPGITKN